MLNNVLSCNFQGLIIDVLLCICRFKAFSKLEVTDTQNMIFRIFPGPTSEDCYSLRLWKGFFYLLTYRYRNHVNSFNQAGRKRLFFLTGSLGCDSESAMFFQLTFCPRMPHNKTLLPKPLQGASNVVPRSQHQKSKLENHSKWLYLFLALKKEPDKKRRLKRSLYFYLSIFYRSTQF